MLTKAKSKTNMQNRKFIILLRPEFGTAITRAYRQVNPPIGLGYIASYLAKHGYKVKIFDLALRAIEDDALFYYIERTKPIFVGLSALTAYYDELRKLSLKLRDHFPNLTIMLGGVHVSSLPKISLKECKADYLVQGEGEQILLEFLDAKANNRNVNDIDGLVYIEGDEVICNPRHELISDLDGIPFPDWKQINPNLYPRNPHGILLKRKMVAPILASRGCPFNCHYCASCRFWGQKIRFRSPENVVDEIQYLHEEFGIREIHFWDDNLTMKRSHIIGICKEIISRGLHHMRFSTPNGVRVDTLDYKIMRYMKAAGFYAMTFAVESGEKKILRENGKLMDLKKIIKNTVVAKKLGFLLNSYFMVGFPGDSEKTIRKTIQFAKSVPFDYRTFFLLKPLPGSKIFSEWTKGKDMLDFDWNGLSSYMQANRFVLKELSSDYLEKIHKKAHSENILRIPGLIKLLFISLTHFHFSQLKFEIERIIHIFFGYNVSVFNS